MKRLHVLASLLLIPAVALASETDAIGIYLTIMAIFLGWIICHIAFFIAYLIKPKVPRRVGLCITSLGLLVVGAFMFFNDPDRLFEIRSLVFLALGVIGFGAAMMVKPMTSL